MDRGHASPRVHPGTTLGRMPGDPRRRRLVVELTDEAHAGLDTLTSRYRVTRTALFEAIGILGPTVQLPDEVVDLANRIDRERRSRR